MGSPSHRQHRRSRTKSDAQINWRGNGGKHQKQITQKRVLLVDFVFFGYRHVAQTDNMTFFASKRSPVSATGSHEAWPVPAPPRLGWRLRLCTCSSSWTTTEGVTPSSRPACPKVRGRDALSLSTASCGMALILRRPRNPSGGMGLSTRLAGLSQATQPASGKNMGSVAGRDGGRDGRTSCSQCPQGARAVPRVCTQ